MSLKRLEEKINYYKNYEKSLTWNNLHTKDDLRRRIAGLEQAKTLVEINDDD